jgi:hypothetical protein
MPLSRRATAAGLAAMGAFALALQLWIMLRNAAVAGTSLLAVVGSFVSFFTVLANFLVVVGLAAAIPAVPPRALRFLVDAAGAAALAGYITVVGVVYHLVLRQLWDPKGAQLAADVLLHTVMPPAYVLYWLAFVPKGRLGWRDVWPALVFPVLYTAACLVRGALMHIYPYPFLDMDALGYPRVLRNVMLLFAGFVVVSLAYIAIDRAMRRDLGAAGAR